MWIDSDDGVKRETSAGGVAWQVKAFAAKPNDAGSIPRAHMAEEENRILKVVL